LIVKTRHRTAGRLVLASIGLALASHGHFQASPSATYLDAARVTAAFAKGMPLVETGGYKIHASRREAPGMAEVHVQDTDIIYVLEGTATVVTGGDVVNGRTLEGTTDEIRGASIRGGTAQRLSRGDVFIVPNGVPHQFTEVQAPFLYYVVKATDGGRR
jgi:mannose-6-phosphate isomerase-like protein (cupin superfamily)